MILQVISKLRIYLAEKLFADLLGDTFLMPFNHALFPFSFIMRPSVLRPSAVVATLGEGQKSRRQHGAGDVVLLVCFVVE